MEQIMKVENLSISYEDKKAIEGLNLTIFKNKITAIIGPSGCGKTTLLHSLNGLIKENPQVTMKGDIYLDGKNTRQLSGDELRKSVGLVFQTPTPFPFSVYKNLTYAPKYYGIKSKTKLDGIVENKLKMVGLEEELQNQWHKNAMKFSGGQQQRICIARALSVEPEVLLLDEPCSALDVKNIEIIEKTLLSLKKNYTIVIVTHNMVQAKRISDRVIFMKDGKLVEEGETMEFFEHPKEEESKKFIGGVFG
ncbi:MAG: phosphate ABC transporter ATP-binding protein [Lachnospiraceae bacterium]|nr:phosphate ABC transporter ATP-binding protein [Lachnospiraceae bacterium]